MRGCLTTLFVLLAAFLVGATLLLPAAASGLVTGALGLAGFSGSNEQVNVTTSSPLELLGLHVDRIRVRATKASYHEVTMASVDVTLDNVALLDRTAGVVDGTLTGVRYAPPGGAPVTISLVSLSGGGSSIDATFNLSATDVRLLAVGAVKDATGLTASRVTLGAPDRASVVVAGVTVSGQLAIDGDGGLLWSPTAPIAQLAGPIRLIAPGPGVPFRMTSVNVASTGVTLRGTLTESILGG